MKRTEMISHELSSNIKTDRLPNKPHVNTFDEPSFYTYRELFPFSNIIQQVS